MACMCPHPDRSHGPAGCWEWDGTRLCLCAARPPADGRTLLRSRPMGWGEAKGPTPAEQRDQAEMAAGALLAAAVRKYKGWRSTRNEEAMFDALAAYDATITPGPNHA